MIVLKINTAKIDKDRLYKGAKGTYLDVILFENEAPDQYGNDYVAIQGVSQEDRKAGKKGNILGNGKKLTKGGGGGGNSSPAPKKNIPDDDVPF